VTSTPSDVIAIGTAFSQLRSVIRRIADRRDVRGRLADILVPPVRELRKSMDELTEDGQGLMQMLNRAQMPLGRSDSNELCLACANTFDATVKVVEGIHRLAM